MASQERDEWMRQVLGIDIVKGGLVYKSATETLNTAWAHDQENGTNLRKVLQGLLKPYE